MFIFVGILFKIFNIIIMTILNLITYSFNLLRILKKNVHSLKIKSKFATLKFKNKFKFNIIINKKTI